MIDANVQEFWNWFIKNEAELFNFESNQEKIFDHISAKIQNVDPNLTFEFGPKNTKREFVISAGGIKSAFPAVVSLVRAAPILDRWEIIAFRPRRSPLNIVTFGSKRIDPINVEFSLLNNGKKAGIYLFIPGFREDDIELKQISYLLLDETLGEYDVESRLGLIKVFSPDNYILGVRYPLKELPKLFDHLILQLENRSGNVS